MSVSIEINLKDSASAILKKAEAAHKHEVALSAIGGSARLLIQNHLHDLDNERENKLGGKRTHFYAAAARSVEYSYSGDTVTVGIHHKGIAQRYFGGEIRPVNSKVLTIPAIAEAHGRRAGEFNFLSLVWPKGKTFGALVERERTEISIVKDRRKGRAGNLRVKKGSPLGGRVFFWLVSKATQDADPSVLPQSSEIADTARNAVKKILDSL